MLSRRPRLGRALAALGVIVLLALSIPIVGTALVRSLDQTPPVDLEAAKSAQALVILGGGKRRDAVEYGGDTLGRRTLERVRYGARVARLTGLPVLVAGGSVYGGETEGKLMREALEREFGVPVRWEELRSRTTHENAKYSADILRAAHIDRIVLVAHSVDMPRARAEFEAFGINVIPAPTGLPTGAAEPLDYLPSIAGLLTSYDALYEMGGLAVRKISALVTGG
ncbi:MAG: YdcF family protein [Burkholderiales bacterium]|nr:YdcF family protein [Burkholderiales bacterium]